MIGTWRWCNSSGFFWFFREKGWNDGGHGGMTFYVLSRGLEDIMFVCVGGVDSVRQNWEVSEFLCCRGLKDMVFVCVGLMRERERDRDRTWRCSFYHVSERESL